METNTAPSAGMAEALNNLLVAATDAANAGRQFSRDFEAARRRIHLERLDRQRRWEQMRAEHHSQPTEAS